ncbi:MAG: DUF4402 domain-containing protein [Thermoanaerobaculia bacterium]
MRRILAGIAFAAFGLITTGTAAANQVTATANPSATITITTDQGLGFGSIMAAPAGGTVTVAPDGTRTLSGLFGLSGGISAASFTVEVSGDNPHYQITLPPSTVLVGSGGAQMIVDTFQSLPAGTGNAKPPGRQETMTVGAMLHVGAAQPVGTYNGVFHVTVNLN